MKKIILTLLLFGSMSFAQSQQVCPVEIGKLDTSNGFKANLVAPMLGVRPSQSYFIINYKNRSDKEVTTVRFGVGYLNLMRELYDVDTVTTKEHNLKPGKGYAVTGANGHITGGDKTKSVGWVEKVMFSDGTYWNDDGSRSCGNFKVPAEMVSDTPGTKPNVAATPTTPRLWKEFAGNSHDMVAFVKKGGGMTMVSSMPPGSSVRVGDKEIGTTPLMLALLPGEKYSISIVRDGYKVFTRDVTAGDTFFVQLEADSVAATK